jgi:cell wall integrity and stress response component
VAYTTDTGGEVKTITVSGSSSTAGADSASANTGDATSSKLSGGSIAGIVIGVLGGIALVGALIFLIFFYRKRARAVSPIPSQDMADNRTSRGSSFMRGFFPQGEGAGGPIPTRSGTTFTDNRMKTNTVLYPNGARESSVSLQDNEDYSRPVLRVRQIPAPNCSKCLLTLCFLAHQPRLKCPMGGPMIKPTKFPFSRHPAPIN